MTVLKHAIKILEAVEKKIEEVGPHPALDAAKKEAQEVIDRESGLPPEQEELLRENVRAVIEQMLKPKGMPNPAPPGHG